MFLREIPNFKDWISESTSTFIIVLHIIAYTVIISIIDGSYALGEYAASLTFDAIMIDQGEFWRLGTWIFVSENLEGILFGLFWFVIVATSFEKTIGKYRTAFFFGSNILLISFFFYIYELINPSGYIYFSLNVATLSILTAYIFIIIFRKEWLNEIEIKRLFIVVAFFLLSTIFIESTFEANVLVLYSLTLIISMINSSIFIPKKSLLENYNETDPVPNQFKNDYIFCPYCGAMANLEETTCRECSSEIPIIIRQPSSKQKEFTLNDWLINIGLITFSLIIFPYFYIGLSIQRIKIISQISGLYAVLFAIALLLISVINITITFSLINF